VTAPRDASGLLAGIGRTPLLELHLVRDAAPGVRLFAKLEARNPGGSVKDRPVARMLQDALAAGSLSGGRRLLDSSSGNAGIAYAMLGAALGVPVTIVVPGNASRERLDRIRAHGAELILTDPVEGYDFALREAQRLALEHPDRFFYCNQYANAGNWRSHYEGTGVEILAEVTAATGAPPDAFVTGIGTGGTLTGVGRRLRQARQQICILAVIPEAFPGLEGLKPLGQPGDIVPEILDESLIDERLTVTSEEAAAMCHRLARDGLFVGPSSGANVHAALHLAGRRGLHSIVTLLCDSGERYRSTGLWTS